MSRAQCPRCMRPQSHCLCELIPQLASRTRVLLLQHPSEVNHALNTARLAALGLTNAQLVVGEVFEDLATLLNPPGYRARLLFPGDDAQLIEADTVGDQQLPLHHGSDDDQRDEGRSERHPHQLPRLAGTCRRVTRAWGCVHGSGRSWKDALGRATVTHARLRLRRGRA